MMVRSEQVHQPQRHRQLQVPGYYGWDKLYNLVSRVVMSIF